jgi:hypothetical protein
MEHRPRSLGEVAAPPPFRTIDGVSIRFAESDQRNVDACSSLRGQRSTTERHVLARTSEAVSS